jgi:Zn-dependent M16 (insulinase) family peptidase
MVVMLNPLLLLLLMSISFGDLKPDALVSGFRAKAMYKNGDGQAMGGRFVHEKSGFILDLIEIQTVPQSYVCVNSFPTSNMGEPHTQEHLLLGKGNVGRAAAAKETMSMVESTAFTQQLRTCYPFAANAGIEAFFEHFERSSYALLNPDYTDEEIRREVRNFGVKPGAEGKLELEEKGTIYAEMVSAFSQPGYRTYRAMGRLLLGQEHPMSFDSGGDPKYIREMKPEHIRRFHAANYHLANMEMITSLPKGLALDVALARFDAILQRLQGQKPVRRPSSLRELPAPRPSAKGTIQIVEFPSKNLQQPGPAQIAWPVGKRFSPREEGLAELFAQAFGGDPSTNLYKLFIDSKTRKMDIGARSIALGFDNEVYSGFMVYIPDLAPVHANAEGLQQITALVKKEMERVAAWPDGSAELKEFHERIQANLLRMRRSADKLTSSPPGFGGRMSQSIWPNLLRDLNDEPSFEKSLMQPELFAYLESVVAGDKNVWRDKIREWNLVAEIPYAVAAKASSDLIAREEAEYGQRIAAETKRLQEQYRIEDAQAAIARYQQDYDAASAELDRVSNLDSPARFIDQPPMTLDDQLDYSVTKLAGGIPLVTGKFAGMTSATIGLALNARELRSRQLIFATVLPQLLTAAGMTKDGKLLRYEEAMQQMRREILGVGASHQTNATTKRIELGFTGAGNSLAEAKASIGWMEAALFRPNWALSNLNRLRDIVDQSLNALRSTMQRSEETWVNGPAYAWTYQDDPLYLTVTSFHTQLHHLHRLRWMLLDAASASDLKALEQMFEELAARPLPVSKESMDAMVGQLPETARAIGAEAAKDLSYLQQELPENSRAQDWKYLLRIMREDLATTSTQALAELEGVRKTLLKKGNARMHLTASAENAAILEPLLQGLIAGLSDEAPGAAAEPAPRAVARRVMAREKLEQEPQFVGLLAPNMQGGVHLHSVPSVSIRDLSESAAIDFLAFKIFGGGGPHGVFMKTWGAGLAYSNGLRASAFEGRSAYYAERTPELPQTLKFVIQELKNAPREKPLAEYSLAQVFAGTRAGASFESRTAAMAADLADGLGPDVVRAFRENVLRLRQKPDLDRLLYTRMDALYGQVLPGYNGKTPAIAGSTYYVIGPEKQLSAWEKYLGERVYRLYPRDYWVVVP